MTATLTEIKPQVIELSEKALWTFCDDFFGMFNAEMKCSRQDSGDETVEGLKKIFTDPAAVITVKAEGALNGTFQLVFDQNGLFTLAGVISMQPEQMIRENINLAEPEKAQNMSGAFTEVGAAIVGAWDRIFHRGLDGHGSFIPMKTFIGNPWDGPEEKINLPVNEEFVFVPYQMTMGSYPSFKCGVIFPKVLFNDTSITISDESSPVVEEQKTNEITEQTPQEVKTEKGDMTQKTTSEMSVSPAGVYEKTTQAENKKQPKSETTTRPELIYAKDIMQKDVLWSGPDDSVQQTLEKIQQHNAGYVMIGLEGTLQGIVSRSDLRAALSPYLRPELEKWRRPLDDATLKIRVKWIMSTPVNTIHLETPAAEIMENMCHFSQHALPVMDQEGKVAGLVTVFDIFKSLKKTFSEKKDDAFENYVLHVVNVIRRWFSSPD